MNTNLKELQKKIKYNHTFDCVQCGYCLPVCPTYETMGKETHSPRGRISLVKLAAEGKIKTEDLIDPIEKCLGCRACQTACPTDVQYGQILEGAKEAIKEYKKQSTSKKFLKKLAFEYLFPFPPRMKMIGNLTWLYQKFGAQTLLRKLRLTAIAPFHLGEFEAILPKTPSPKERNTRKSVYSAELNKKVRVAFFTGCVMDVLFFYTNQNTIDLLTKSGAEVVLPKHQTCCGALHAHAGEVEQAKELAKRNIEAFEEVQADFLINNAGGCGAMLSEYNHLFKDDPKWRERAKKFVQASQDISQILEKLDGLQFTKKINNVVTYQASCHLTHVQKVVKEPTSLFLKIPGVDYKVMNDHDRCCGSAGIYNIVNYDESMKILDEKMKHVKATKTTTIVTTNPGCLLQMKLGIKRENAENQIRAIHLVDLLAEAGPEPKGKKLR